MDTKELIIHLIKEDMRFNQFTAALRKAGIEAYCFDLDLTSIVAELMNQEMSNIWIGMYVMELCNSEGLPIKPLGENLNRPAEKCYYKMLNFEEDEMII
jgi:hypothetical protein